VYEDGHGLQEMARYQIEVRALASLVPTSLPLVQAFRLMSVHMDVELHLSLLLAFSNRF